MAELKQLQKKKREILQERAKNDLQYLFEEILGYNKLAPFHLEVIEVLKHVEQSKEKKGLFLLPRGHWKSTLITIAYTIQRILRDPNISVFITNATLGNSQAFLKEIKNQFEKCEKLRDLFGDYVGDKWTDSEILVKPRTAKHKEPTVRIGSVEHSVVSAHFDLIILDDLVNRENTNTKEQCDKVIQYYRDALALGKEDKTMYIVVGTRWHYADIYEFILQQAKVLKNFIVVSKSCWKDEKKTEPLFYRFSAEHLHRLREQMGAHDFAKQYENSIIDDSVAEFKLSWMKQTFSEKDLFGKSLRTFIAIDAAMSKAETSDYTGVVVVSIDAAGNWYIRFVKRLRINTTELVDLIFDLWMNFEWKRAGLHAIGIEQKAFQDLVRPLLKAEGDRRGIFPIVKELKDFKRRKENRIRGALQGRLEYGKIYFKENPDDDTQFLIDELLRFPYADHDDLSDATAYIADFLSAPKEQSSEGRLSSDEREFIAYRQAEARSARLTTFNRI